MPFDFKKFDAKCACMSQEELQREWEHYTRLISGAATSTAVSGAAIPFTLGVSVIGVGLAAPAIHNARKKREIIERHLQTHGATHKTRKRDVFGPMAVSGTVGVVTLGVGSMGADAVMNAGAEHGVSSIVENELAVKAGTHLAFDLGAMKLEQIHTTSKKESEAFKAQQKVGLSPEKMAEAGMYASPYATNNPQYHLQHTGTYNMEPSYPAVPIPHRYSASFTSDLTPSTQSEKQHDNSQIQPLYPKPLTLSPPADYSSGGYFPLPHHPGGPMSTASSVVASNTAASYFPPPPRPGARTPMHLPTPGSSAEGPYFPPPPPSPSCPGEKTSIQSSAPATHPASLYFPPPPRQSDKPSTYLPSSSPSPLPPTSSTSATRPALTYTPARAPSPMPAFPHAMHSSAFPTYAPTPPSSSMPIYAPAPAPSSIPTYTPAPPTSSMPISTPAIAATSTPTYSPAPPSSMMDTYPLAPATSPMPTYSPNRAPSPMPYYIPAQATSPMNAPQAIPAYSPAPAPSPIPVYSPAPAYTPAPAYSPAPAYASATAYPTDSKLPLVQQGAGVNPPPPGLSINSEKISMQSQPAEYSYFYNYPTRV